MQIFKIFDSHDVTVRFSTGKSVLLGDLPTITTKRTYRVPLIGLDSQTLPKQVMLVIAAQGKYPRDIEMSLLHEIALRGDVASAQTTPTVGCFAVESPTLDPGDYDAWVLGID